MKLVTAVLMTMAAMAWAARLFLAPHLDELSLVDWLVPGLFALAAVFYWVLYIRSRSADRKVD